MRVRYVNSEEFTNDFINSVREESIEEFQRRYREVDVLLIDDIQFIQGKERTVEEFFHTFNSLYNAGKQIVLTSDVPPRELDLEDRIRSRFAAGLFGRRPSSRLGNPYRNLAKEGQCGKYRS